MSHAAVLIALDPTADEANVEDLVAEQMAPFSEGGDWFRDGSRWDWYVIGGRYSGRLNGKDVIRLREFDLATFRREQVARAEDRWEAAQKDRPEVRDFIYGLKPEDTRDTLVAEAESLNFYVPYAFLRNMRWDESNRMGWFGCATATECENKGKDVNRCLWRDQKSEVLLCSWNEPHEQWREKFHERFIAPLDPDTLLVVVDYHV